MKNEYIIINKTQLLKRIEETEKEYFKVKGNDDADEHFLDGKRTSFKEILSQSTPLIPEIERAYDAGLKSDMEYFIKLPKHENLKKDYISNLKLDR